MFCVGVETGDLFNTGINENEKRILYIMRGSDPTGRGIKCKRLCNRRLSTNIVSVVNRGEYGERVEWDEK